MRRVRVSLIVFAVLVVAIAGVLSIGLPRLAAHRLARATGLEVVVGSAWIAWSEREIVLGDVVVRDGSGATILEAETLFVPWTGRVDGPSPLRGREVALLGSPPVDVRSPDLRVHAEGDVIAIDGTIIAGERRVTIEGGRFDRVASRMDAERIRARGLTIGATTFPVSVAVRRLAVRDGRLGTLRVDRLIAEDVRTGAAPTRLRAVLRESGGTLRVRWTTDPARLDLRAAAFPLRAALGAVFRDATLSGGVVGGLVRVGRRPGVLEGRLRVGATQLSRGAETWLGWETFVARIGAFDLRSRRLMAVDVDVVEPVVRVWRDAAYVWPFGGWSEWLDPPTMQSVAAVIAALAGRFTAQAASQPIDEGDASIALARGTVTVVDDTMQPPARLALRDVAGHVRYALATMQVDARVDGVIAEGARFEAAVEGAPTPRALLAVHALPVDVIGGWGASGARVLGIPLGRAMALTGGSVLDLRVDVPGDGREKRFGLASKALRALIGEIQDRVTTPLLAAAEEDREATGQVLSLPVVPIDLGEAELSPEAADVADRVAVLLAQFRELSVRVDGRAGPDEPIDAGGKRARRIEAHLSALGFTDRVEVGPAIVGTPGVVIVVRGGAGAG